MLSRAGASAPPTSSPSAGALARPLPRAGDRAVSGAAFALLFAELVSYHQARVSAASELEARLEGAGRGVGARLLEALAQRDRPQRRDLSAVAALQFVSGACWAALFGRAADALERSTDASHGGLAFMIRDADPLAGHYVSMPRELARINVAAFQAGGVRGLLEALGLPCDSVQAVAVPAPAPLVNPRDGVVFLIRFGAEVIAREQQA